MVVLTSIRPSVLTPTSNNWYENISTLNIFYIPEHFLKLCGKYMLGSKLTRTMGTLMNTYV